LVSLTVAEPNHTFDIDGEILAVIFDDPTAPANNSIILMYGAQSNAGDSFNANLANPVDLTNASFTATMGIGDSFGFQPANQFSTIAINGTQITSSAGGQDDCVVKYDAAPDFSACQDGALITVGGLGDSAANPPDPNADDSTCGSPAAPRCDDELYDLKPFLNNGDTSIQVDTLNASNNDNIFFAALDLTATSAIVGEGVLLSPDTATNPVGASHTVTATVSDANGSPVANQLVSFNVVSGPNSGVNGSASTNASGQATFTYSSAVAGTDTIQASFTNANTQTFTSNQVTKTWTSATNAGGAFVIGDGSAGAPTVGRNVNFWGAQWAKSNTFTCGGAPAAMKGFADRVQSLNCGSTFVTRPGNSANPPARLPSSIQVIVTSKVTKSGSSITGNIAHIVNVQVNPGYGPNPGHRGTGTITGVVC